MDRVIISNVLVDFNEEYLYKFYLFFKYYTMTPSFIIFLTITPYLIALDAACGKLLLVAAGAVDLLLPGDEGLGANGRLADAATEAVLVPLPSFVFHLLGT